MKSLLFAMAICTAMGAYAQNVGIGTSFPNPNAKLDITATDKGLLIPRMDSVHRKTIPNTIGLLVYDSSTASFWYNTGAAWQNLATANSGWSLTGNSGIDTSKNFLGTTDDHPLIFKVNNQFAGQISTNSISIGSGSYKGHDDPGSIAIGTGALANSDYTTFNNQANSNTAIGHYSLTSNINGSSNTGVGLY